MNQRPDGMDTTPKTKGQSHSVVMIGATGAVGSHTASRLVSMPTVSRITLLGRRPLKGLKSALLQQAVIDIFDPASYEPLLGGHDTAICTLGVGQPSKMSKEDFKRIDHDAVLDFATACRKAGVAHFELLSSIGAKPDSKSYYLGMKGKLEQGLKSLGFSKLSLFHPSMILTPHNRYGLLQGLLLKVWPLFTPLLAGPLRPYRGIQVERLGQAMALGVERQGDPLEVFHWDDIERLARK